LGVLEAVKIMNSLLWVFGVIIVVTTLVYAPAIPLGYFDERKKEAATGNGPGPSTRLTALAWLARIYYVIMAVFFVIPWLFGSVVPRLWRVVVVLVPAADDVFAGTSGLILTVIGVAVGLVLFFALAGWAFRLGWRIQDRNPQS
jgi:hypothetical protein